MTDNELLKFAVENGIIDIETVQQQIIMKERNQYLEKHPYSIWEDKNGVWHTYLPDDKKGRLHKRKKTEEEIKNMVIEFWKEQEETTTVSDIFSIWIESKVEYGEISLSTRDRYEYDFRKYFDDIKNCNIEDIDEDFLEDYVKTSIRKFGMSSKSYGNFRTLLFGIFKTAKKKKLIDFSITQAVSNMDISKRTFKKVVKNANEQVYSVDEKKNMEEYLIRHKDLVNLGLLLIFKTGLRVGELATIKKEDVNNYTIAIKRTETRYKDENGNYHYEVKDFPKSEAGLRYAIIPEQYKWIIDELMNTDSKEWLFEKNGKRIKTYSFQKRIRVLCKNHLNMECNKSPHKIRKTFGTLLIDGNAKESTILSVMGHTDIKTTDTHYYFDMSGIEDKREELGNIKGL